MIPVYIKEYLKDASNITEEAMEKVASSVKIAESLSEEKDCLMQEVIRLNEHCDNLSDKVTYLEKEAGKTQSYNSEDFSDMASLGQPVQMNDSEKAHNMFSISSATQGSEAGSSLQDKRDYVIKSLSDLI